MQDHAQFFSAWDIMNDISLSFPYFFFWVYFRKRKSFLEALEMQSQIYFQKSWKEKGFLIAHTENSIPS